MWQDLNLAEQEDSAASNHQVHGKFTDARLVWIVPDRVELLEINLLCYK